MKRTFAFALAMLVATAGIAAGPSKADADAAEVAAYRLSGATMKKVEDVVTRLSAAAAKDPAFRNELSALGGSDDEDEDEASGPASLDDMVALVNASPEFAKILASAGLASREYLLFTFALLQAGLAESLSDPGAKLPPGTSAVLAENIRWVREHKSEVDRLTADWQRLTAAAESEELDGEGDGD
jgi:hypothetical protein